jgi:uncharacterized repeat protein (TIGR01451 family)
VSGPKQGDEELVTVSWCNEGGVKSAAQTVTVSLPPELSPVADGTAAVGAWPRRCVVTAWEGPGTPATVVCEAGIVGSGMCDALALPVQVSAAAPCDAPMSGAATLFPGDPAPCLDGDDFALLDETIQCTSPLTKKVQPADGAGPGDVLHYSVFFENDTADPIAGVLVSDPLPSELDITTVQHVSTGGVVDTATRTLTWDLPELVLQPGQIGGVSFDARLGADVPACHAVDNVAWVSLGGAAAAPTESWSATTGGCPESACDAGPGAGIEAITEAGLVLWPPDHAAVEVSLSDCVAVTDACGQAIDIDAQGTILWVTCDEAEDAPGMGDGATLDDIVLLGPATVRLRAERHGAGDGRVYTLGFALASGAEGVCRVHVPANQGSDEAADSGAAYVVSAD